MAVVGWAVRRYSAVLVLALVVAILGPVVLAPRAGAQDLVPDDQAWVEQRLLEAAIYLGGGPETPLFRPEEMIEFEDWYRDCLTRGILAGIPRAAVLDFCAERLVSPLAEPQEWLAAAEVLALAFLDELLEEEVERFFAGIAATEYRDCLKGLARTRVLDEEPAREICSFEARTALEIALAPPPTPTPVPPTRTATPGPTASPTPSRFIAPTEVVYRADMSGFSGEAAHLSWINGGPVDTRLAAGAAELRLDSISHTMRGPAMFRVTLLGEGGPDAPLCLHARMQVEGTAPITPGSAADTEGITLVFQGVLTRTFDGADCPPEREFVARGGVASLRAMLFPDTERNENTIALCSLAPADTPRDECRRNAIAVLRPVRPN